jgi:SAM-dependent methyltransferase
MDEGTLRAYGAHAAEIAQRHATSRSVQAGISQYFGRAFDPGARILDVGAGAGFDLALLVWQGYQARGVEPVGEMRTEATRLHPELSGRLLEGSLPDQLPDLKDLGGPFDGVVCSAVLQHLPRAALFAAVFALRRLLRPGGHALVLIPTRRNDIDEEGRDRFGRYFSGVQTEELDQLFQRAGFRTLDRWDEEDSLGRGGVLQWATLLFELGDDDRVESPA